MYFQAIQMHCYIAKVLKIHTIFHQNGYLYSIQTKSQSLTAFFA